MSVGGQVIDIVWFWSIREDESSQSVSSGLEPVGFSRGCTLDKGYICSRTKKNRLEVSREDYIRKLSAPDFFFPFLRFIGKRHERYKTTEQRQRLT